MWTSKENGPLFGPFEEQPQQSKWTIFWTIWKIITRIEMDHYLDHSEMDHFYKNGPLFGPFEPTSKWTITTKSRGHNWTTVLF